MESTKRWSFENDVKNTYKRCKTSERGFSHLSLEPFQNLLSFLPFEDVANCRLVSKYWNEVSMYALNLEFIRVKKEVLKRHNHYQKIIKSIKKKEQKKHPLFKGSRMLESVYVRLTVLNLRMGKHLERKELCFYGGKLLDEINLILKGERTHIPVPLDDFLILIAKIENHFLVRIQPNLPERIFMEKVDVAMSIGAVDSNLCHLFAVTDKDINRDDNVFGTPYSFIEQDKLFTKVEDASFVF